MNNFGSCGAAKIIQAALAKTASEFHKKINNDSRDTKMVAVPIYQVVIGLEVHVHLKTESKMFCGCSTEYTLEPNVEVCPVCAGFPGVLPVLNEKAKEYALLTALALNCKINSFSQFARKQYFYPDLPKNYQISQYDLPLAENGFLAVGIEGKVKKIGITRVHLEEDAGKLLHYIGSRSLDHSLLDLNRSGVPLLEIVSSPDLNSSEEAFNYLQELKALLQYIGVSDCNMEEGSLRCDANVSLRKQGSSTLGVRTELKNMNSFRAVKKALDYEAKRQTEVLSRDERVIQETRLWDEKEEVTHSMRRKEEAHDYRYFPEPDLLPLLIDEAEIEDARKNLPESPAQRRERFQNQYGLSKYDTAVLTAEKALADFYEATVEEYSKNKKLQPEAYKKIANWVMGEVKAQLKAKKIKADKSLATPRYLAELIALIEEDKMSQKYAKENLEKVMEGQCGENYLPCPVHFMKDEEATRRLIRGELNRNKEEIKRFQQGEEKILGFLIGQVMKVAGGQIDPKLVNKILREMLKKD